MILPDTGGAGDRDTGKPTLGSALGGDLPLAGHDRDVGAFLARLLRLHPGACVRLQLRGDRLTLWGAPLRVVVRRDVLLPTAAMAGFDTTVDAQELLGRLVDVGPTPLPPSRDGSWRVGLPPEHGWATLDRVPAAVVTRLARVTADAVRAAADPTAAGDIVLAQTVLTVTDDGDRIELPGRVVAALHGMAFLRPGPDAGTGADAVGGDVVHVATTGAWGRVQAAYGSVYLRRPGAGMTLL